MSGPFDFLHIKGRTAGSSNELSFDVLDAARSETENKKGKSARLPAGVKPSQGSYHGVTGASTFSAAPEVARRKQVRRAHSLRVVVITLLVVAVFVGAGSFFLYQYVGNKNDFNGRFNALIEQLVEVDSGMMEVDALMQNPVELVDVQATSESEAARSNSTSEERSRESAAPATLNDVLVLLPSVKRNLNSIAAESQSMKEIATRDAEIAALSQLEAASKARLDMVEAAEKATSIATEANKRVVIVNEAWNKVLDADSMVREATTLANEADTEEKTIAAREETEKARELLIGAKKVLLAQESGKPKVEFKEEAEYLDKRVEALGEAVKTSNYLLIHNRSGAELANESYNSADKAAAALASKLPDSEGEKVAQAYRLELEKIGKSYEQGRAAASTADSAIRSYRERG